MNFVKKIIFSLKTLANTKNCPIFALTKTKEVLYHTTKK
ncbi:hypothetical protein BCF50_2614 [Chryseobacterium daecheongense]|uniref:Cyclic lactone autoinducer peptide n=1 Tax=Chryseobacterium daecheongense TaxID=192389 RepID=A0ABY2FTV8_9FLAO|nr:hypothetical protein BCF50_2614 [Chryseobacterium daecheongense]